MPHAARKLRRQGFRNPIALQTWESHELTRGDRRLRITALPGTHGPEPLVRVLPPVMGSLLELDPGQRPFRIYVSGDTLVDDRLHEIRLRFPDIDLGLLHLGGTKVLGVLLTMDAAQGIRALRRVKPRQTVPIHTDDYTVRRSSLEEFLTAVTREGADLPTQIVAVPRGGVVPITRLGVF